MTAALLPVITAAIFSIAGGLGIVTLARSLSALRNRDTL